MKEPLNIVISSPEEKHNKQTILQVQKEVVRKLLKHVDLESIYSFGFSTEENYQENPLLEAGASSSKKWQVNLLLIGEKFSYAATTNLSHAVNQDSDGQINLCLMCHSPTQIARFPDNQKHFYAKIITRGVWLHGKDYELRELGLQLLPDLNHKRIWNYTNSRLRISTGIMENIESFLHEPLIATILLRNVIEQLLLSLVHFSIYYIPNLSRIPYLLQLCINWCGLPTSFFADALFRKKRNKPFFNLTARDLNWRDCDSISGGEILMFFKDVLNFKTLILPVIKEKQTNLLK